jgi:hypothetical protein
VSWTTARTWVDGELMTREKLQTLRDNLLETMPAKAVAAGDVFYAPAAGSLARLPAGANGAFLALDGGIPRWIG